VPIVVALLPPSASAAPAGDPIDALLKGGGFDRTELAVSELGAAPGLVREGAIPFRLPLADEARRNPLGLAGLAESFRVAAARGARSGGREKWRESSASFLFAWATVQPRLGSFSLGGSPNLPDESDLAGILDLALRGPKGLAPCVGSFGQVDCSARLPSTPSRRAQQLAASIPASLRPPLARLLLPLVDADLRVRLAWRRVPPEVAGRAARAEGLTELILVGDHLLTDVDDAALALDSELLASAAMEAAAAVERGAAELADATAKAPASELAGLQVEIPTPRGAILLSGTADDLHRAPARGRKPWIAVDLGGNDRWEGEWGAALWPELPLSVVLDLAGNDRWSSPKGRPSQGSGLGGIGILWDAAGDDRYEAFDRSQAFAQLGAALLVDESGRDAYLLDRSGQGAALFGSAMLLDRGGDDEYLLGVDGQGWGGPGGAALLADLDGNDRYTAERDPAKTGRPDPRTAETPGGPLLASTSNAQGAGVGRRADASDGRAWGGGLGALVDLAGDDRYLCGTFCQGIGYWFGFGLLVDGAGSDRWQADWWAQGAGAHGAVGELVDFAGDDLHELAGRGGASLGFASDFAVGFFLDRAGADRYRARRLAFGSALERSVALFVDEGGDDAYELEDGRSGFGAAALDADLAAPTPVAPLWHEGRQISLFLDLGGTDAYPAESTRGNDRSWSGNFPLEVPRNLGAGWDGTGKIDWSRKRAPGDVTPGFPSP
jgi:hypothetical protein